MAKYHINAKGEPGICHASAGNCPFGGEDEHYRSKGEARDAFEESMEKAYVETMSRDSSTPSNSETTVKNQVVARVQEMSDDPAQLAQQLRQLANSIDTLTPQQRYLAQKEKFNQNFKRLVAHDDSYWVDPLSAGEITEHYRQALAYGGRWQQHSIRQRLSSALRNNLSLAQMPTSEFRVKYGEVLKGVTGPDLELAVSDYPTVLRNRYGRAMNIPQPDDVRRDELLQHQRWGTSQMSMGEEDRYLLGKYCQEVSPGRWNVFDNSGAITAWQVPQDVSLDRTEEYERDWTPS